MKYVFALIIFFSELQYSSAGEQKNSEHSWGNVDKISSNTINSKIKLRFNSINYGTDRQISEGKRIIYYALSPNQQLQINVEKYETINLPSNILDSLSIYIAENDSSIIRPVNTYDSKQSYRNSISVTPQVVISKYEYYRGYYLARIEISPFIFNPQLNVIQEIRNINLNFIRSASLKSKTEIKPLNRNDWHFEQLLRDMIINYDDVIPPESVSSSFRATSWFNPSAQYLKMAAAKDGLYRLTYQQLQNAFPSLLNADPRTIQLFSNGNEIPLFIKGESDGIFNTTDYLEFPALKNYTDKHRIISTGIQEYNEYLNRYCDSTIYWLTCSVANGLRMSSNTDISLSAETLKVYTDVRHLESNSTIQYSGSDVVMQQNPLWTSHDVWGWGFIGANGNITSSFSISDVAFNSDSIRAYGKFVSWGASIDSNAHTVSVRVNNSGDLGETTINKYEQAIIKGALNTSALIEGNNTVGIFSKPTNATSVNWIIPDWLEIEYPRQLKAIDDSLLFGFRNLTSRTVRTVQISNYSSQDIAIYKIKPVLEKISNVSFSSSAPYTVTFIDTVGPQELYIAITNSRPLTPVLKTVKQFANISADKRQTDYLIVTHKKFIQEAEQYRQFIAASKKMTTRLIDVDDIFDEFGYGYPTPLAMRDYFQSTTGWNAPIPSFLFLIGDASYDYKFVYGNTKAQNYVPSFGYPVSDALLVTYDSLSVFPQMYVGRLPVNNVGEVMQYLNRIKIYADMPNSEWNKRYQFFSGGDPNTSGQVESFKGVNDFVLNTYVRPAPIGAEGIHFYKTKTPQTDFGPYTSQQIKETIAAGSVFISYIGHSGTQTWDNSIGDPVQLQNTQGKFPLITDFGCSTGKFAEPNVTSFSESFVIGNSSSAIGYIGNASLGFTSIAEQLPKEFYKKILHDSVRTIGKAHLLGKVAMALNNISDLNKVMLYTNTLIGDPSIDLAVPFTPNLFVTPANIKTQSTISDEMDSVGVSVAMMNYGSVIADSVNIHFQQRFNGQVVKNVVVRRPIPLFSDTVKFFISVKNKSGEHTVLVTIDSLNRISEINKQDNYVQKSIFVNSTNYRVIQPIERNNGKVDKLVLLNPVAFSTDTTRSVILEIDSTADFISQKSFISRMGQLTTEFSASTLALSNRYWWRAKINSPLASWTTGTFYQGIESGYKVGQNDTLAWSENIYTNIDATVTSDKKINAKIRNTKISLRAISSGFLDGAFGNVELNGINVLSNTFGRGIRLVVLDTVNYLVADQKSFDVFGNANNADSIVSYINRIQSGMIVVVVIVDEGTNNLSSAARNAFGLIGAKDAGKLGYRDSWAVIGRKGTAAGTAIEMYKASTTGKAIVETTYTKIETAGSIVTPEIGPMASWKSLAVDESLPDGAHSIVTIMGIKQNKAVDTLMTSESAVIDLQTISASSYPKIKVRFDLKANSSYQTPVISSWTAAVLPPAELATNNTLVKCYLNENGTTGKEIFSNDTVAQGEKLTFQYSVYNVGGVVAKNISVALSSIWDNNINEIISNSIIDSLQPQTFKELSSLYNTSLGAGRRTIKLSIDPDSSIKEMYKDNNLYSFPLFIKKSSGNPLLPNLSITQNAATSVPSQITDETDTVRFSIVYANLGSLVNDSISIQIKHFYQSNLFSTQVVRRKYPVSYDTVRIAMPILKNAGEHQLSIDLDFNGLIVESSESDNQTNYYFTVATTDFKVLYPSANNISSVDQIIFLNPTSNTGNSASIALDVDTLSAFSTPRSFTKPIQQFATSFALPGLKKMKRYFWRVKVINGGRDWTTGSFYSGDSALPAFGQMDSTAWKQNIFTHTAFSSDSGARITDTRNQIKALSAGFSDGNNGSVTINGVNVITPILGSGHNIVVADTTSFGVVQQRRFNITSNPGESDSLIQYISAIPNGRIVIDVVVDEGANNLTPAARNALKIIGSTYIDQLSFRDSWAIIGKKGAVIGSVPESYKAQNSGSAAAETTIVRREKNGMVETPLIGPFTTLSNLTLDQTVPSGTELKVQFVGISSANTIDTVITAVNQSSISLSSVNAKKYRNGKLLFSFNTPSAFKNRRAVSAVNSPSLKSWKITATSSTELAASDQSSSINRNLVMEGEIIQFSGRVYNVSNVAADSVMVQLKTTASGIDNILKRQWFTRIPANDSVNFSFPYDTRGKHGNHAFTFEIDPLDSLSEQSKSNNSVTIPYVVQADTLRPTLQVTFDGTQIVNGDYVAEHPEIRIKFTDNNPSTLLSSDTSNFKIRLNNYPVPYTPGSAELLTSNTPGRADIRWTPTLASGENVIQIYAKDISDNYSDTILVYVNVATEFRILDIFNLPNPFSNSTAFTFNLAGPTNPDEVIVKIYTVAGRLIQELTTTGIIGFNKIAWDGRDKDGDVIGNGVYLYKVIVKQGNKQIEGLSKLVKMR